MWETLDHVILSNVVFLIAHSATDQRVNNDLYIKDLRSLIVSGHDGIALWLTDQIINRIGKILNNDDLNTGNTYYIMDSYFYAMLTNMKGRPKMDIIYYDNVKDWFKPKGRKKDKIIIKLFNRKIIFIPIHVVNHWILYIIFFEYNTIICLNSGEKSPKGKVHSTKSLRKFKQIFEWMNKEHKHQCGGSDNYFNENDWTFEFFQNNPIQENSKDCGVFVLVSIIYIILNGSIDNITQYVTQDKMPDYRQKIASVLGLHYNIIDHNGACLVEVINFASNVI